MRTIVNIVAIDQIPAAPLVVAVPMTEGRIPDAKLVLAGIPMQFLYEHLPIQLEFLRAAAHSLNARSEPMLDLALFVGFALVCLFIAYERLCKRL